MACKSHPAGFGPEDEWEESLIVARWPETDPDALIDRFAIAEFTLIMDLIRAIRNLRSEKDVSPGRKIIAKIQAGEHYALLESMRDALSRLAQLNPEELVIAEKLEELPEGAIPLVVGSIETGSPMNWILLEHKLSVWKIYLRAHLQHAHQKKSWRKRRPNSRP